MPTNFYMYFVVALIPLAVGAIYYNPKVMGGAWMKTNGFTEEYLGEANMIPIFAFTYLLSFFMAFFMTGMVIHQSSIVSLLIPEALESGSVVQQDINEFLSKYGDRHRTWSHGAVHGVFTAIFFILPIIGINALFERRGWKYIFIHFGYWLISLSIMGAILCATIVYGPLS